MLRKQIPNMMTLTHLCFGMSAIIFSFNGEYSKAAFFVILGMILDGFDGRVARALGVNGEFGKELDSLADVVTFGVAPSLLMYNASFIHLGTLGIILTLLFPACGVLRLAKFNVHGHKNTNYFSGLPITAAGGILAVLGTYHEAIPTVALVILSLLLSCVMVSNYKYPNFKKTSIPKHAYIVTPILGVGIYFFRKVYPEHFIFIISTLLTFYLVFLIYQIKLQMKHKKREEENEKDDNIVG